MWLEIGRDDFVDAIRRLKPERVLKSVLKREIQIGFLRGEAVFNVNGAETRRAAKGKWPGFVSFNFGRALTYIEVPPATDPVRRWSSPKIDCASIHRVSLPLGARR